MKEKIGITFFFGAGAECGVDNFGICSGERYLESTFSGVSPKQKELLKNHFPEVAGCYFEKTNDTDCDIKEIDRTFYSIALHKNLAPTESQSESEANDFARIFHYYWLCYLAIARGVNKVLPGLDRYQNEDYLLSHLYDYHDELEKKDISFLRHTRPESYYSVINGFLKNSKDFYCRGIGTSNYFRFCEIIASKEKPCFLNGRFGYFEFPDLFEVKKKLPKNMPIFRGKPALFFPFMLGMSYTKPIIDNEQIRNFVNFGRSLSSSRFFVILGYGLKKEDNHINAYLARHIRQGNKHTIIVVKDPEEERKAREVIGDLGKTETIKFVYYQPGQDSPKSPREVVKEVFSYIDSKAEEVRKAIIDKRAKRGKNDESKP